MMSEIPGVSEELLGYNSPIISKIMKKHPQSKTEADITQLVNEFKSVKFFEKYNNSSEQHVLRQCCKYLSLEVFEEGTTVFEIGSVGDKFYIIIEGKVGVDVRLEKNDETLKRVKVLSKGESFGEIALIYKKPRLATIQCTSKCTFAVLQQKHFQSTIQQTEMNMMLKDMQTFCSMALFDSWTSNKLRELYLNSVWLTLKKGQQVYDLGEQADSMYVIQEGEFVVYSRLIFEKQDKSSIKDDSGFHQMKRHRTSKDINGMGQYFKVRILCSGEYFGEEEILKNQDRQFRIACNSFEGKLLMIKKQHFLNTVLSDPISSNYIKSRLNDKADKSEQRIKQMTSSLSNYQSFLFQQPKEAIEKQPIPRPSISKEVLNSVQNIVQPPLSSLKTMILNEKQLISSKLQRGNSTIISETISPLKQSQQLIQSPSQQQPQQQMNSPQKLQNYNSFSSLTTLDAHEYLNLSPARNGSLKKIPFQQSPEQQQQQQQLSNSSQNFRPKFTRLNTIEVHPCSQLPPKQEVSPNSHSNNNPSMFCSPFQIKLKQSAKYSMERIASQKDLEIDESKQVSLPSITKCKSISNLSPTDSDAKSGSLLFRSPTNNNAITYQQQQQQPNAYFSQLVSLRVIEEETAQQQQHLNSIPSLSGIPAAASISELDDNNNNNNKIEVQMSPREKRVSFQSDVTTRSSNSTSNNHTSVMLMSPNQKTFEKYKIEDSKKKSIQLFSTDVSPLRSPIKFKRQVKGEKKDSNSSEMTYFSERIPEELQEDTISYRNRQKFQKIMPTSCSESLKKEESCCSQESSEPRHSLIIRSRQLSISQFKLEDSKLKGGVQQQNSEQINKDAMQQNDANSTLLEGKSSLEKEIQVSPYLRKKLQNLSRAKSVQKQSSFTVSLDLKYSNAMRKMQKKRKEQSSRLPQTQSMMSYQQHLTHTHLSSNQSIQSFFPFENNDSFMIFSNESAQKFKESQIGSERDSFISYSRQNRGQPEIDHSNEQLSHHNSIFRSPPSRKGTANTAATGALLNSRSTGFITPFNAGETTEQVTQQLPRTKNNHSETIHFSYISENKKKILLNHLSKEKVQTFLQTQMFMRRVNSNKPQSKKHNQSSQSPQPPSSAAATATTATQSSMKNYFKAKVGSSNSNQYSDEASITSENVLFPRQKLSIQQVSTSAKSEKNFMKAVQIPSRQRIPERYSLTSSLLESQSNSLFSSTTSSYK